jgi:glutamate/tyrosine decarboxylase-like PLP-dependent enzyme
LRLSDIKEAVNKDRTGGKRPFCVVANAGTTNTGAVDPLRRLSDYCRQENLWLHVDGAFGASAVLCDRGKKILAGLDAVDSLSIDPHKWLFQPYETGCVLVKDRHALKDTYRILPEYLEDTQLTEEEVNFCDYGIQLTRSFRALKLWMSLQIFGVEAFRQAVEKGFSLAEYAQDVISKYKEFEIVTPAQMAVVTFRYIIPGKDDKYLDDLNERIVDAMIRSGFAMIISTVLRGRRVLRICTTNPRTTQEDVRATIERIKHFGDELCQ